MEGGTVPWMSPELLDPQSFGLKKSRPTRESDCYALGMVTYEIISEQAPFAPSKAPVLNILRGNRPERRPQFTDDMWGTLGLCWKHQPSERINARTALLRFEETPLPSQPTSPNTNGDAIETQLPAIPGMFFFASSFHPELTPDHSLSYT